MDEYSGIAPYYDLVTAPFLDPVRRQVKRLIVDKGFRSVLDLCCGTGRQLNMLRDVCKRLEGVDLSPSMLHVAKTKNPRGISYYLEDATNLHFPDNDLDCTIIAFALHEKPVSLRKNILTEGLRVLSPGGICFVVDYLYPHRLPQKTGMKFIAGIERMAGKDHHANYRDFLQRGATDKLLQSLNLEYSLSQRFYWGTVGLYSIRSEK